MTERNSLFTQSDFELLFKTEFKGMCYFSMKYVKDLDTARNIVQEAFATLWEKKDAIDTEKSIKSYLSSIVYSRSLNYLRDNKKFNKDLLENEGISIQGDYESDSRVLTMELKESIEAAIEELPEKCREIFILSRYEHKKYQEIADLLGISIKTVEAQMSKALQHMRSRLAPYLFWLLLISIESGSFLYN